MSTSFEIIESSGSARRRAAIALGLSVALTLPLAAVAPHGAAADDGALDQARAHWKQGVKLFDEQDYRAALIEFKRAYQLTPSFAVLYNIAQCEYQLLDYAGALDAFERYVAEGGAQIPPERRTKVDKDLAELRGRVATVTIEVAIPGVEVFVDDALVGTTPLGKPIRLNTGRRQLRATKAGFEPTTKTIDVAGGDVTTVEMALVASGATLGEKPAPAKLSPLMYVGAATAVVGFSVGTVFGVLALGKKSDLDGACRDKVCPSGRQSTLDAMSRDATVSTVGFGVGLVGVGLGIYGLLQSGSSTPEAAPTPTHASVHPWIGVGSMGLSGVF